MNESLKLGMLRTPITPQVAEPITTEAGLVTAIENATAGSVENPVEIILGDAITLTDTIFVSGSDRHILLKPKNGNTKITRGSYAAFNVANSASLTLEDVTIDGEERATNGSLIYVGNNGTLNLNSGSKITRGNSGDNSGGGIYVFNGTVNINGGIISDNRSENNSGGGIYALASTINVNSGSIHNNTGRNGGGIYAVTSIINLNGGQIVNNRVSNSVYYGSNIYLYGYSSSEQTTLNTTNGVIYNENISGVDSIYRANSFSNWEGLKEKAIVIERAENPSASYTAGTENELSFTADASSTYSPTVNWAYRNGVSGIAYQNDDNIGFFEVDGVTVNRKIVDSGQLPGNTANFTYNSQPQGITEREIEGYNQQDFGAMTFKYADAGSENYREGMPTQVGEYQAKFETAGGNIYQAYESTDAITFFINKATPTKSDFTYPTTTNLAYRSEGWTINNQIKPKDATLTNYKVRYVKDGRETATMKEAGTYQIKIIVGENTNFKNASIITNGKVTIADKPQPAATNFKATIEENYVYNGEQPIIEITSDIAELGEIDTIIKQDGNESNSTNVGEYQVYARTKETENYGAADILLGSFNITEKPLAVTVDDVTLQQGETLPEATINYDGFVAGQTQTDLFSTLPSARFESDGKTAGTFGITLNPGIKTEIGNNYAVTYGSGSLIVKEQTIPEPEPSDPDRLPLYRVYNKNNGEHLYTLSQSEAQGLIDKGWQDEGIGWYGGEKTGKAAYRLYNPNSGEHFYTLDQAEYDSVGEAGWNKEGIAFYAAENNEIPIYRVFNPNAQDAGSHHYTLGTTENTGLVREGWRSEGVGFYGK
ncbi:MBG domain-containing protein [Enterococcus alishanensis]